jgi:hypothetical protein
MFFLFVCESFPNAKVQILFDDRVRSEEDQCLLFVVVVVIRSAFFAACLWSARHGVLFFEKSIIILNPAFESFD